MSTYPREGCVKVQSRINYKPACGIVELTKRMDSMMSEVDRQKKILARLEKAGRQDRRGGEWRKRGSR